MEKWICFFFPTEGGIRMPVKVLGFQRLVLRTYGASNVALANDTWVKVQFNNEQFDIGGYYDPTTNYRYTPLVAGKYQINARVYITYGSASTENIRIAIYKNGAAYTLYNDYGGSTQSYLYASI